MDRNIELRWPAVYKKTFGPLVFLTLAVLLLDAVVEYRTVGGFSPIVIKDFITVALCAIPYALFRFGVMSKQNVIALMVYTIVIGIMVMLPYRVQRPHIEFEVYFLKIEIILVILTYAIGILVNPRHIIDLLVMNLVFIAFCYFYTASFFDTEKYWYYIALITGTGVLGYKLHKIFIDINMQLGEANLVIQKQNTDLSKANDAKDQLLEILGHDLKAPFFHSSALMSLIDETTDSQKKEEYRALMKQAINDGDELVASLLDWVDVQSDYMKFELSAYDMRAILEEAISEVESAATLKDIKIHEDYNCGPLVKMDAKLMETIVRNLLNNAIKFSHNGAEVFVRMRCDKKNVTVEVEDFGVGIEPERIEELFKVGQIRPSMGTK